MKTRTFNNTGIQVSEIGLGCWQLGGTDWGILDEKVAFEILSVAVDSGVNFFDTADVYGNGRSETLIGKFLKQSRKDIFVATKLGRTSNLYPSNYSEAGLRAATEASLKRLGVEVLDLTQLHCVPTDVLRKGDVFEWLRKLQREGKIRHFGASVESMEEALLCLQQNGLVSLQIIFNLFRQKPIETLFDKAKAKSVALIVRLPLASGLLSGKLTQNSRFAEQDHRTYNRDGQFFNVGETFAGLPFQKGVELSNALKQLVPNGMDMAQMAQRWILDHDAVTVVIPGASRPEQATANASVSALPRLEPELHASFRRFYEVEVAKHIRGPY
jgi:aryl-alcohol dehydrogenase-like predicted oxidoreductase